jgi:hypothetical protein
MISSRCAGTGIVASGLLKSRDTDELGLTLASARKSGNVTAPGDVTRAETVFDAREVPFRSPVHLSSRPPRFSAIPRADALKRLSGYAK